MKNPMRRKRKPTITLLHIAVRGTPEDSPAACGYSADHTKAEVDEAIANDVPCCTRCVVVVLSTTNAQADRLDALIDLARKPL